MLIYDRMNGHGRVNAWQVMPALIGSQGLDNCDGTVLTVTPTDVVPELPKLSVALTVMGSLPVVPSVSLSDASVLSTSVNEPLTVSFVVPLFCTLAEPDAVAASRPLVSLSTTVNVSGDPVFPISPTLMVLPPGWRWT